jgi:hypothetical protein
MSAADKPPRRGPTTAQYFLGLFVLWQLFFLFASNLISLGDTLRDSDKEYLSKEWKQRLNLLAPGWENKQGHFHDALNVVESITLRWEQLSAQPQNWSLFAPGVSEQVTFVAVELRWDDPDGADWEKGQMPYAPEPLLSDNEPRDPTRFFRLGKFRLRKYESYLDVILRQYEKETPEEAVEHWQGKIRELVKDQSATIPAYLKLRYRQYAEEHPDRPPPRQVILLVRRYTIPEPEDYSEDWYHHRKTVPVARWRPGVVRADGYQVEWFKPTGLKKGKVTGSFESLSD